MTLLPELRKRSESFRLSGKGSGAAWLFPPRALVQRTSSALGIRSSPPSASPLPSSPVILWRPCGRGANVARRGLSSLSGLIKRSRRFLATLSTSSGPGSLLTLPARSSAMLAAPLFRSLGRSSSEGATRSFQGAVFSTYQPSAGSR